MRLIDADELPYTNIKTNEYGYVETTKTVVLEEDIASAQTISAIFIPEGATNRNMIEAMFSDVEFNRGEDGISTLFMKMNNVAGYASLYESWLDAPYKGYKND